jgi:hypothetical protein
VDGAGNASVTGWTNSADFPTQDPVQAAFSGVFDDNDAFVTKLNASGTALVYSTYLGDVGIIQHGDLDRQGIAVDNSGNAYVTGFTASRDFPTANPIQANYGGGFDAFVAKIGVPGFRLDAPQTALSGTTFTLTVTALDENGQPDTGYRGTIHFRISDGSAAILPSEYTFTAGDNGQHAFQVTLQSAGRQTITAIDSTGTITGTADVLVPQPPVPSFDWRMPQHFGQDNLTASYDPNYGTTTFTTGPDGLIDYPWENPGYAQAYVNGNDFLHPYLWKVYLDASSSTGTGALSYSWGQFTVTDASGQIRPANVTNLQAVPGSPGLYTADFPALGTYSATLTVTDAYGQTSKVTRNVVVKDHLIVSIGDSFGSGEGAPDVPQGHDVNNNTTSAVWEDGRTHRSANAAAAQAALAIQNADPHASVTFISVAASGAQITTGALQGYRGTIPPTLDSGLLEPQLQQVKELIGKRTIDALVMSLGGNDVGFANIVEELAVPDPLFGNDLDPSPVSESAIAAQFQNGLDGLPGLYGDLNYAIHSTYQLPVKNTYITEYADPTHDASGGYSSFPLALGGITAQKAQWAHDNVLLPLNQEIQQQAQRFGWHYIGGIDDAFTTHGVSAGDQRWFNTVEDSFAIEGVYNGTVHPNYAGWQAEGQLVKQQILTGGTSIQGTVFDDLDRSGVLAPAEDRRLTGWTVYLDLNHDGTRDPGDPTTVTDLVDGTYSFSGLAAGTYVVRAVPPDGSWFPSTASVTADVFSNALDGPQVADLGFYHPNTATLHDSADGRPVTLTSPDGTTLADVQAVPNPSPGDTPGGVQFPVGFFAFQVQGLAAGGSTTVTLTPPTGVAVNTYYKYGVTPDDRTPHWYSFLFDGTTGAEFNGNQIVLHFVDGQRGDDDLSANGIVSDVGGPALYIPVASITGPAVGERGNPEHFIVATRDLSASAVAAGFSYTLNWGDGGALQTIAATPGNGAGMAVDHVFATPGTYTVTLTATDQNGVSGDPVTCTIVINPTSVNPIPLVVTVANATKPYGQDDSGALTGTITGLVNGDNITAIFQSTGSVAGANAGTYGIMAVLSDNGTGALSNYAVTINPGTLTVTPAPLTVTANNASTVYGSGLPTLSDTITGFVNNDDISAVSGAANLSTTATSSSGVGTYTITAAQGTLTATNYTFTFTNGTLEITPAPLTITADNQTMVYGGSEPSLTATYTGLVNGDTPGSLTTAPTFSTAAANSHVGDYSITISGAVDPNYTISYVSGTLTVTPAALTITADNKSMTYGEPLPALTASYAGFVNGDKPASLTTLPTLSTVPANSHVGNYAITASGAVDPDYSISYVTGTLMITPAPLTITADSLTKVYGVPLPILTASYSGFVNGDTASSLTTPPTLSTTATGSTDVGVYPITVGEAVDSDYSIGYVNGMLTILKANQTINWSNPPNIVVGTPLSSTQLNAIVSVVGPAPGGALTYSPPAGTVLGSGSGQVLTVTAAATNDYNAATFSVTINVLYNFGGFEPPLRQNGSYQTGRTIPIKFELMDANGNAITDLNAVASLQIQAVDANGKPQGSPFNPASTGNTTLRNDGGDFIFNWDTKGLGPGYYDILLRLSDGTTKVLMIQLT